MVDLWLKSFIVDRGDFVSFFKSYCFWLFVLLRVSMLDIAFKTAKLLVLSVGGIE